MNDLIKIAQYSFTGGLMCKLALYLLSLQFGIKESNLDLILGQTNLCQADESYCDLVFNNFEYDEKYALEIQWLLLECFYGYLHGIMTYFMYVKIYRKFDYYLMF